MDLLLLADPSERMIDRYLARGDLFALCEEGLKSICVVTKESDGVYEIKNIATREQDQRRGYASALIRYLFEYYMGSCKTMYVGTGDSPLTIPFYEHCGFRRSHIQKNFFVDYYEEPIYENGA